MKPKILFTLITITILAVMAFGSWDNSKPADSDAWNDAAGYIRDNWDALEVVLGEDLASGMLMSSTYIVYKDSSTYYAQSSPESGLPNYSNSDFVDLMDSVLTHTANNRKFVVKDGSYTLTKTLTIPNMGIGSIFDAEGTCFDYTPNTGDAVILKGGFGSRFKFGTIQFHSGSTGALLRVQNESDVNFLMNITSWQSLLGNASAATDTGQGLYIDTSEEGISTNSFIGTNITRFDKGIITAGGGNNDTNWFWVSYIYGCNTCIEAGPENNCVWEVNVYSGTDGIAIKTAGNEDYWHVIMGGFGTALIIDSGAAENYFFIHPKITEFTMVDNSGNYTNVIDGPYKRVRGDGTVNPTNLINDGDFEIWSAGTSSTPDGWTAWLTPTIARDTGDVGYGSYSVKLTRTNVTDIEGIYYTLTGLRASTKYSVSCRTKVTAGDTSRVGTSAAGTEMVATDSTSTTFETKTGTFVTDASGTNVILKLLAVNNGDIVWFDGIQVNQGDSAFAFNDKPVDNLTTVIVDITSTQIKALAATPRELVAAPGAGKLTEFVSAVLLLDYGSEVLAEPSDPDNLAIEYDDGSGQQIITWDTTGFITSNADAMEIVNSASVGGRGSAITTAANVNKNIVLINTGGNYTGNASNDTVIRVIINYRVHTSLSL